MYTEDNDHQNGAMNLPGHENCSPYSLVNTATELMKKSILDLPKKRDKKIVTLINSSETYPNMSKYQVEQSRILLLDLYINHKLYGNAYELCEKILEVNPKASIKKKYGMLVKTKETSPELLQYSVDQNIVDTDLCYQAPYNNHDTFCQDYEDILREILSKYDENYVNLFYNSRKNRRNSDPCAEVDIFTLNAMNKYLSISSEDLDYIIQVAKENELVAANWHLRSRY